MLTFRGLIYSVLNKLNVNRTSDFQKTNMQMKLECESRSQNKCFNIQIKCIIYLISTFIYLFSVFQMRRYKCIFITDYSTVLTAISTGVQCGSCYVGFSFMCMSCRSLFVLLYFCFWPLYVLFFFDKRIQITPLVSSNSCFHLNIKER